MIRLENIHKWFGSMEVLRGIDLEVTRGEVVVVIGPSGSGKSTLLRVINYLEPFQEGVAATACPRETSWEPWRSRFTPAI